MKNVKMVQIALFLFGTIGVVVGGALLITPIDFEASADIQFYEQTSLLSEIRSYGSVVLAGGIIVLIGAFTEKMRGVALVTSVVFYGAIGSTRIFSFVVDGRPSATLVSATIAELAIACIASIFLLFYYKKRKATTFG